MARKVNTKAPPGANYSEDFGNAFQRHIIAIAARVPGFALRVRDVLEPQYFVADAHKAIARVLFTHIDEHHALPSKPTLLEDLRATVGDDDMEVVAATVREIYKEPIQDHAAVESRVVAFGKRQAMLVAVIEGAEKIDKGEPAAVEPLIRKAMLVGENLSNVGTDFATNLKDRVRRYKSPELDAAQRIPTGISHLDFMMKGGLRRGSLGVLLAPPKRGKSTGLINFGFAALTALAGFNVFHYTFEMNEKQVLARYDDRLMGNLVRVRGTDVDKFTSALQKRAAKRLHGKLLVKEYPTRTATVSMLRSNLSVMAAQGMRPDLVIVDYASIMKASQRRAGEYRHEQASIFEDLRGLAGEFNCALWSGHQANRGALDKETVTMGDVAETFEVAHVVDALVALCQTPDEQADGVCRLFGAALRDVESEWTVHCRIRRDACRITSTAVEDVSRSRIYTPFDERGEEDDGGDLSKQHRLARARRAGGVSKSEKQQKPKHRTASPSKKVPQ